ncbi:MAG: glutamate--tRNA ligase [Cytophagales bacterium]|jgi:glutamyl-tRNA synthetase|nr:glutamate--tRNA ligase [Cytophagales bacterium]
MEIRVRFAPSPTGGLHIGGVRTALYNYLFAKKMGGKMLLRIEDTDQKRFVPGAEEYIIESLKWVGIQIDEGQGVGGPHAPYRQSERREIYQQYAQQLLDAGHAYYAFDTEDEIEAMRQRLQAAGAANTSYNALTRTQMRNSLTLGADETKRLMDAGTPYVVRAKIPLKEEIRFKDLIRDWQVVHANTLDDKVLMKSDGLPTYHLANIVDDHLMQITHVIRGEEWLPSAPLHVLLYKFFGWQAPQFAHLPLILKPDLLDEKGNVIEVRHGKLSKRDADEMNFPIFPLTWNGTNDNDEDITSVGYREAGYYTDALINFLALLGWNDGSDKEFFTVDELVQSFSLERVHKAGSKFDIRKAKWFNQHYLRAKSDTELAAGVVEALKRQNIACTTEKAEKIVRLMKERVTFPQEIHEQTMFLFAASETYDATAVQTKWNAEAAGLLSNFKDELTTLTDFNAEAAKHTLHVVLEKAGVKIGKVMPALRLALTGAANGPDLMQIMDILGRDETQNRIALALGKLGR